MKKHLLYNWLSISIIIFSFLNVNLYSQLNVTSGGTAIALAQQLAGPGVTVMNATLSIENNNQVGTFSNGNSTNLGLDAGVILSSGNTLNASNPASYFASSDYTSLGCGFLGLEPCPTNEPDLQSITSSDVYDVAILEFDFIPSGPVINFDFVFASEEYTAYVNDINDAFGIFLSGPGINGPYSNNGVNIALVPGTSTPISINTVNNGYSNTCNPSGPCTNCAFYVNNCSGSSIAYNGFTTPITASYSVECGQVYRIKFAIADAIDGGYDSSVFIESSSLTSGVDITPVSSTICVGENVTLTANVVGSQGGTYFWEPNGETTSSITVSPNTTTDYTVYYTIGSCEVTDMATVIVDNCGSQCTINLSTTVGGCANDLYDVTGTVAFTNPPTTGQLIVEDCNGNQQTFSAPFTSPQNFNLTDLDANGDACSITAYFTDDATCTAVSNYTAPECTYPCLISSINNSVNPCDVDGTFPITGEIEFENPPTTGQLIIETCTGETQVFNPPFTSPTQYQISGLPTDGNTCDVTAYFTADNTCSISIGYTNQINCTCSAQIGTFTDNGVSYTNPLNQLCYGDDFSINSNGNFNYPEEIIGAQDPLSPNYDPNAPDYDPGIAWLVYSCQPTVGLTPNPGDLIPNDPCLVGILPLQDLVDINDLSFINQFPPGTFTNNTIYFVPITMYSMVDMIYSYSATSMPCYQMGNVYSIQYLTEITETTVEDCGTGTVSTTVSGGSPEVNGTNYTASNVSPSTASITTGSVGNGGTIVISGLNPGDVYSFDITDDAGCFVTITGTFEGGGQSSSVTAPNDIDICLGESVTITANNPDNEAFTWDNGITDGVPFTPTAVGSTTYTVTSSAGGCISTDQVTVSVHALPIITLTANQNVCEGESVVISATGAQTYVWDNGATGSSNTIIITSDTTINVIGTTAYGCVSDESISINLQPALVPTFVADEVVGCQPHIVNFTNTTVGGGSNCLWSFGDGSTSTGCNTVAHNYISSGFYSVTLTVTNDIGCQGTTTYSNYIEVLESPIADFSADPAIANIMEPEISFSNESSNATEYIWDFGDDSPISNTVSPIHSYTDAPAGNYIVTLIASNGNKECDDTLRAVITIEDDLIFYVPNSFTPDGDTYNDRFKPIFTTGYDPQTYTLEIFNRWGELIFVSHDVDHGWDGTYGLKNNNIVKEGTYIWKIKIKETLKDKHNEYSGHVILLK